MSIFQLISVILQSSLKREKVNVKCFARNNQSISIHLIENEKLVDNNLNVFVGYNKNSTKVIFSNYGAKYIAKIENIDDAKWDIYCKKYLIYNMNDGKNINEYIEQIGIKIRVHYWLKDGFYIGFSSNWNFFQRIYCYCLALKGLREFNDNRQA